MTRKKVLEAIEAFERGTGGGEAVETALSVMRLFLHRDSEVRELAELVAKYAQCDGCPCACYENELAIGTNCEEKMENLFITYLDMEE